jgi:hypothetical protein
MLQRLSVLGLMVLAAACSGGPVHGGGTDEPDAGGDPEPIEDPTPPAAKPDAAAPSNTTPPVVSPDAAPAAPEPDAGAALSPDAGSPVSTTPPPDDYDYTCTLVIGISATGQWFNAGFEKLVDGNKWEVIAVHSAKVEAWANPADKLWSNNPSSACTMNAKNPDRILFTGLNWIYDKVEQWVPPLTASVKNLQAKYPGVKRIELRTFIRAPMNKPCPGGSDYKSFIKPAQDEAYEIVAKMFPGLVYVAPKLEVKSCADFGGNAPHFTGGGAQTAARTVAAAYGAKVP